MVAQDFVAAAAKRINDCNTASLDFIHDHISNFTNILIVLFAYNCCKGPRPPPLRYWGLAALFDYPTPTTESPISVPSTGGCIASKTGPPSEGSPGKSYRAVSVQSLPETRCGIIENTFILLRT